MRTEYETIRVEFKKPDLVFLTLNRPSVLNAFNSKMGQELRDIFVPLRFGSGDLRGHRHHG